MDHFKRSIETSGQICRSLDYFVPSQWIHIHNHVQKLDLKVTVVNVRVVLLWRSIVGAGAGCLCS
jgi:hypothetical protein